MQRCLESVFILFPNSDKNNFKTFEETCIGSFDTALLQNTGYSKMKLDLYIFQMWSKKYWATIISQQIRLRGWSNSQLLAIAD